MTFEHEDDELAQQQRSAVAKEIKEGIRIVAVKNEYGYEYWQVEAWMGSLGRWLAVSKRMESKEEADECKELIERARDEG